MFPGQCWGLMFLLLPLPWFESGQCHSLSGYLGLWSLCSAGVQAAGGFLSAGEQNLWMDSWKASLAGSSWKKFLISICQHGCHIISLWWQGLGILWRKRMHPSLSVATRHAEMPALDLSGPQGKMSLPTRMCLQAFSCENALEDPALMTPPPSDMDSIPQKPVIPEHSISTSSRWRKERPVRLPLP